ncbi:MAG: hypothetical protein ACYDDS_18560 [Candidatus Sulfotelmatobacter sp.]
MSSIRRRDVACAEWPDIRRFEHFLKLLNIVNDAFHVHASQSSRKKHGAVNLKRYLRRSTVAHWSHSHCRDQTVVGDFGGCRFGSKLVICDQPFRSLRNSITLTNQRSHMTNEAENKPQLQEPKHGSSNIIPKADPSQGNRNQSNAPQGISKKNPSQDSNPQNKDQPQKKVV